MPSHWDTKQQNKRERLPPFRALTREQIEDFDRVKRQAEIHNTVKSLQPAYRLLGADLNRGEHDQIFERIAQVEGKLADLKDLLEVEMESHV